MNRSLVRKAVFFPIAGVMLWLCWAVLTMGLSIAAQRRGLTEPATTLAPNPYAYALGADQMLEAKAPPAEIGAMATKALRLAPLQANALRSQALAEKAMGHDARYRRFLELAGQSGWRDRLTQLEILMRALEAGHRRIALDRAEASIRLGSERAAMFQILRLLAVGDQESETLLVTRLKAMPSWRADFFNADGNIPKEQNDAMGRILTDLAAAHSPVKPSEARATLALMINHGELPKAWKLYTTLFPRHSRTQLLSDSGFNRPDADYRTGNTATPFDWTLFDVDNGGALIDRSGEYRRNPALFAQIEGSGGSSVLVEQSTPLTTGRYVLRFKVRGDSDRARSFGHWTVICNNDSHEIAASSNAPLAGDAWTTERLFFTVPAGCGGARVRLITTPDSAMGNAQLWYDDVTLSPAG